MPPLIDRRSCVGCGTCAELCPMGVFSGTEGDGVPVARHEEECWHCNACVTDCPENALTLRIPLPAMVLYVDAGTKREAQE
jgi:adenylylsulfate reductase, subunit B